MDKINNKDKRRDDVTDLGVNQDKFECINRSSIINLDLQLEFMCKAYGVLKNEKIPKMERIVKTQILFNELVSKLPIEVLENRYPEFINSLWGEHDPSRMREEIEKCGYPVIDLKGNVDGDCGGYGVGSLLTHFDYNEGYYLQIKGLIEFLSKNDISITTFTSDESKINIIKGNGETAELGICSEVDKILQNIRLVLNTPIPVEIINLAGHSTMLHHEGWCVLILVPDDKWLIYFSEWGYGKFYPQFGHALIKKTDNDKFEKNTLLHEDNHALHSNFEDLSNLYEFQMKIESIAFAIGKNFDHNLAILEVGKFIDHIKGELFANFDLLVKGKLRTEFYYYRKILLILHESSICSDFSLERKRLSIEMMNVFMNSMFRYLERLDILIKLSKKIGKLEMLRVLILYFKPSQIGKIEQYFRIKLGKSTYISLVDECKNEEFMFKEYNLYLNFDQYFS